MLASLIVSFIDAFLRVFKNIVVNTDKKLLASAVNALLYLFNAIFVKAVASVDLAYSLPIVAGLSFMGCYLAMELAEKITHKKQ